MSTENKLRFFNTTGPCNPDRHYRLAPEDRLVGAQLYRYISDEQMKGHPDITKCDTILLYGAGFNIHGIKDFEKDVIIFLRWKSGPLYLQFETLSPHILRQYTDTAMLKGSRWCWRGQHWMACYGDYRHEIGYALRRVGIEWDSLNV